MKKEKQKDSYCVKRHMFFAVTNPVMKDGLTLDEANKLQNELDDEEQQFGDAIYVHYQVHKE